MNKASQQPSSLLHMNMHLLHFAHKGQKAAALMAYSTSDLSTMHGAYFIKCNAVCVLTKASIIHYENGKDDFEYEKEK